MRFVVFSLIPLLVVAFANPVRSADAPTGTVVKFDKLSSTTPAERTLARYKEHFVAPEGKTVDDIAKTAKIEVGKAKVNILDVQGTWIYKERPFDPKSKTEQRPNSRVIFVIFTTDDGNYLI